MKTTAMNIAKYVIMKCVSEDMPVNNIHLQAILYNINATYLNQYNKTLFDEETTIARFGPMIPNIHYHFGPIFGIMSIIPIQNEYSDYDMSDIDVELIDNEIRVYLKSHEWMLAVAN
ncbi:hypothetical protein J6A31_06445 [bacterium]|nr:hypothetical protein [bacterium]